MEDRVATGFEMNTEATGELTAAPEEMPDTGRNPLSQTYYLVAEVAHGQSDRLMKKTLMQRDDIIETAEMGILEETEALELRDPHITVLRATMILFHGEED